MELHALKSIMKQRNRVSISVSSTPIEEVDEFLNKEGWSVVGKAFTANNGTRFATVGQGKGPGLAEACGEPEPRRQRSEGFLWKTGGGGHGYPTVDWNG